MFDDPLIGSLAGATIVVVLFALLKMFNKDDKEEKANIKTYLKLFVISIVSFFFVLFNFSSVKVSKVLEEAVESGLAPF